MSKSIVATLTYYQHIENGKAVKTGAGVFVDGLDTPLFSQSNHKIGVTDQTYGVMTLACIKAVLNQLLLDNVPLNAHDEIRFITGMPDSAKILNKLNKIYVRCLTDNITTKDGVDKIVYTLTDYGRRNNHEHYVDVVYTALTFNDEGVIVTFYPQPIRTQMGGPLWGDVKKQTLEAI